LNLPKGFIDDDGENQEDEDDLDTRVTLIFLLFPNFNVRGAWSRDLADIGIKVKSKSAIHH
jgi:hypothetical protein